MIIYKKKRALVIRHRNPDRLLSLIHSAKSLIHKGKQLIVVPHKIDEVKVLRNEGIDAPSPIHYYYDWPGQFKPFAAQAETAAFLTLHSKAFNLSDIGTGKSLGTLWAYDYLRNQGKVNKALVIAPLSTLERTWADEIFMHFPHLTAAVLHGPKEKRIKLLKQEADIYIINHDGVKIMQDEFKKRPDIDHVIIDEISQCARNHTTHRWKAINEVVNQQCRRTAWGLTGTPTPNSPTDAWAQCKLLVPSNVDKYFLRFKMQVMRQISSYLWLPRENATEVVFNAMQPAIRFTRDECVDLPPVMYETRVVPLSKEQQLAYKDMVDNLHTELGGGEITAVNEGVKLSKLLQICCIAHGTDVLTDRGWVPIQCVTAEDRVWDGVEWVTQGGAVYKGRKRVVTVGGVRMTDDHKVWVGEWVEAKEIINGNASERFNRAKVRLPNGYSEERFIYGRGQKSAVAVPMRLRNRSYAGEPVPSLEAQDSPEKLRVPPRERNARADQKPAAQYMGEDEATVRKSIRQRLAALWRSRNSCLREVVRIVPKLLRRYGEWVYQGAVAWQDEQQWPVLTGELSLGDACNAIQQPAYKQAHRYTRRTHDSDRSSAVLRPEKNNAGSEVEQVWLDCGESVVRTYDLINCGPRNRFVVRGSREAMIVHNCGVAYDGDRNEITMDASQRLSETLRIVEEASTKVIIYVPFVSSIKLVTEHLRANGQAVEAVHGGTSKTERDRIFGAFQKLAEPRILVAQPAAMSHGLTLTAASTILWYAPITSNDIFEQANGRITRPGQKNNQFIIMLEGAPVERKIYGRLRNKQKVQGVLLSMIQSNR